MKPITTAPKVESKTENTDADKDNVVEANAAEEELVDADPKLPDVPFGKTAGPAKGALTEEDLGASTKQAAAKINEQFRFISTYPNLTIYVYIGLKENVNGQLRDAPSRIRFKNGGFFTSDKKLGEAIKAHPKCGTQLFRFVDNADAAARMVVATEQSDMMRTPTFQGATSSGDGSEQEYLQRQAILEKTRQQAFHG